MANVILTLVLKPVPLGANCFSLQLKMHRSARLAFLHPKRLGVPNLALTMSILGSTQTSRDRVSASYGASNPWFSSLFKAVCV